MQAMAPKQYVSRQRVLLQLGMQKTVAYLSMAYKGAVLTLLAF